MTLGHTLSRLWPVLLGGAALAAGQGHAQTAPISSAAPQFGAAEEQQSMTVTGQRMPGAEAPRSTTCEALAARDPLFRAQINASGGDPLMGPRIYLPSRLPRNPDYSAPPSVPEGSALPTLPKSRFGMRSLILGEAWDDGSGELALGDVAAVESAGISVSQNSLESAIDACRRAYAGGSGGGGGGGGGGFIPADSMLSESGAPHASPDWRAGAARTRFGGARAFIANRDETLPMAFALFDQGRYGESFEWFRKAAAKLPDRDGGDEAALFVGKLYLQGLGGKSDPAQGVKWLKKAAGAPFDPVTETPIFDPKQPERNTAVGEAAVILGNLYRTGFREVPKDPAEARKWYARAFRVGHVPAAKTLGDLHYHGIDTPRDVKKAMSHYREAARLDYPAAQFALAEILYRGEEGVRRDVRAALGWYQAAAKHDHSGALHALGRAYELGEAVKADRQLAIGFYKTAALRGNAAAMAALGRYFHRGELVRKDDAVARGWFEAAAQRSDPQAMVQLAALMAKGEGGERDMAKAWTWLRQAASMGDRTAPAVMAALEAQMTAAEREAAARTSPQP